MANIDPLLERNKHFAATTARQGATGVRVSTPLTPATEFS